MVESVLLIDGAEVWTREICGNKAYTLYKLSQASTINVPWAFAIRWPDLRAAFFEVEEVLYSQQEPSNSVIEETRKNVLNLDLAKSPLVEQVRRALIQVANRNDPKLIARSSSSSEDSTTTAFPGVFESIRVDCELMSVLDAIRRVYASRLLPQAIAYARAFRLMQVRLELIQPMAVLVQLYVKSRLGGVILTIDPISEGTGRLEIAARGAENIVKGQQPDLSLSIDIASGIDPKGTEILTSLIGSTELAQSFQENLLSAVYSTMTVLGSSSVDIEWVWDGDQIWIVQARPITKNRRESSL